jgi:transposase
MRQIKEILRLKHQAGLSHRQIARSCGLSHTAVSNYLERADQAGLRWPLPEALDEAQLHGLLFGAASAASPPSRPLPDMEYLHQELKRKGVTLQLLWEEYRAAYPDGYGYTQFCHYYAGWKRTLEVSLRQPYKAGEKTFLDWAGPTLGWIDPATGQTEAASLFIAVLGASNYTFAEAFVNRQLAHWIEAHIHAFEFFGGVTQVLIPDNERTGVSKPCYYEPTIHATYQELAGHYGTVVIPTRPYAPRDKAKAESAVLHAERRLLAALRDQTFFGVGQINVALRPLLHQLNERPFQKLHGSRRIWFEQVDRPALQPLPKARYAIGQWRTAKANIDYHVQVDWHNYSVPYTLTQQEVEVRLSGRTVEIFHQGRRVALHARSVKRGGFTTDPAHRPKAHQKHLEWTPSRLIGWAQTIGPYCGEVVATLLKRKPHPEQGYRACLGIMRLAKDYGTQRMEKACHRALVLDSCSYKSLASILKTNMDQQPLAEKERPAPPKVPCHANLRGAPYYQSPPAGATGASTGPMRAETT